MNKARRKWLEDIIGKLEEQKEELYNLQQEEQEAYDNMPIEYVHELQQAMRIMGCDKEIEL